jgi:hypothetical protein
VLKSLDSLIGFTAVILLVSLGVTLLTQVVTGALNWRSRNLLRGVMTILNQIDPKATPFAVEQIAGAVLRHPLVARAQGKLGTVIQREELTRILLELAAGNEPGGKALDEYARQTLKKMLESNGIQDPAEVLENIHLLGLKLEALRPELPASMQHAIAVVTEAPSQFAGRIHACFDETMDRNSHRFARHTSLVTAVIAIAVAAGLQLDAFEILRQGAEARLIVPQTWSWNPGKLPGIALSAMLLSLGAPFWYNVLKDLVAFRPSLARKEQELREQRQSASASAVPSAWEGEKGNL